MAARRTSSGGLTEQEVSALREQLTGGGRPRVRLSGPQFGDTAGTVLRIGDPATAGTDYITVRVKVNGVTDELAFAPAELSLRRASTTTRGQAPATARRSGQRRSVTKAPAAGSSATPPARDSQRAAQQAVAPAETTPAELKPPATKPSEIKPTATKPTATKATAPAKVTAAGSGRRRKLAAPPKVSFSVASSGASWTVTASRGAKGIAKNQSIPPGVVSAIAALLDQPALVEAVAEINETALAEAQARADQLRAELDQLEAVLATHRSPR